MYFTYNSSTYAQLINENDESSKREKVVIDYGFSVDLEYSDTINLFKVNELDVFIEFLNENRDKLHEMKPEWKDCEVAIEFRRDDDNHLYMEISPARLETEEEFVCRQQAIKDHPENEKKADLKRAQEWAQKYGYKVVKDE